MVSELQGLVDDVLVEMKSICTLFGKSIILTTPTFSL